MHQESLFGEILFSDIKSNQELADDFKVYKEKGGKGNEYYYVTGRIPERRESVDALWRRYKPYASELFIRDYKQMFHEYLWEMQVGVWLMDNGYTLQKGGSSTFPDIIAKKEGKEIFVECTTLNPPPGSKLAECWKSAKNSYAVDPESEELLKRARLKIFQKINKHKDKRVGKTFYVALSLAGYDLSFFLKNDSNFAAEMRSIPATKNIKGILIGFHRVIDGDSLEISLYDSEA